MSPWVRAVDRLLGTDFNSHPACAWQPSPVPLHAIEQAGDGAVDQAVNWRQTPPIAPVGVGRVRRPLILLPSPAPQLAHDPLRRRAVILTSGGRPVRYPKSAPALRHLLRGGWRYSARLGRAARPAVRLGTVAVLGNHDPGCNNYYHWWADTLADLWFLRESGVDLGRVDSFLMAYGGYPWQQQSLALCGIDQERVVAFADHPALTAEQALVPVRSRGSWVSPVWLARALRELTGWRPPAVTTPGRRIYLSRRDAPRRQAANEAAVERLLVDESGFESHQCSGLSVPRQQALFADAEVIVAPHGAALTNLVWCRPGTRVVELVPEGHRNPCFRDLAAQSGLDYRAILCPATGAGGGLTADIQVPLARLREALAG
ncbi:glycosyltransferase family 61 protein [Alkalilimnicola ehrlichii MLHE-1]|uniref:Capsular polysaccharide biosynthesis protein-like protein n=1 Tax=Alkalilimnicola ehrlichii (strain ATCC BAA-1101 / DSM 17681 / MLHE-1) TaxID=187272 RepID=Q0A627_ALKEH|nr:glycosyltransferase family 61 protein [Alkalilimnicola ehrlichii]ABI57710.1 Capsular polysaccharide biosynthesis protein-like protein [Alkalilimnicola ehrlichii MLHE-1]